MPSTGCIVGSGGAIYRTTDGGTTWSKRTSGTRVRPLRSRLRQRDARLGGRRPRHHSQDHQRRVDVDGAGLRHRGEAARRRLHRRRSRLGGRRLRRHPDDHQRRRDLDAAGRMRACRSAACSSSTTSRAGSSATRARSSRRSTAARTGRRRQSGVTERLYSIAFTDATHGCAVGNTGTILTTSDGGANLDAAQRAHRLCPAQGLLHERDDGLGSRLRRRHHQEHQQRHQLDQAQLGHRALPSRRLLRRRQQRLDLRRERHAALHDHGRVARRLSTDDDGERASTRTSGTTPRRTSPSRALDNYGGSGRG